ncbi:MAG: two pore domain potassium channel family protein, partial [Longispora sp.]|nr:two pore domain potassium channel family protein [Longispora sp. (in: high G+C Gram-positive bacteria)]
MSPRAEPTNIRLPAPEVSPLRKITTRFLMAFALLGVTATIVILGRNGYKDNADSTVSVLDAFYYATVSLSTTGYG